MIQFCIGNIDILCALDKLPLLYDKYREHAKLSDEINIYSDDGQISFFAVRNHETGWPFLVVAQKFSPTTESGFYPGVLVVPETNLLFFGAGERILCYDLKTIKRVWEDVADIGFWCWSRHDGIVLMSAELELAAWNIRGQKLWSTFVEPPWHFEVKDQNIHLNMMGTHSQFNLNRGPTIKHSNIG